MNDLFKISFVSDSLSTVLQSPSIVIGFNWLSIGTLAAIVVIAIIYFRFLKGRLFKGAKVVPIKITFGKDFEVECIIERNEENIFISHRIYIELITRKAAIEIDPEHDVISEVYDSWYKLFGIVRDEIKNVPGRYLLDNKSTSELTRLTIEILNNGLRPHLTKFQADFRRWYKAEADADTSKGLSPQTIQAKYPKYSDLITDMKSVNRILSEYASQLQTIFSPPKR